MNCYYSHLGLQACKELQKAVVYALKYEAGSAQLLTLNMHEIYVYIYMHTLTDACMEYLCRICMYGENG